ncbi:restriction endonuclease [Arthrobacter sp. UNC362MFTsu5.1]|uniref:restriction endonuclease n=1 Tax=Arthrobacter sp. UNC362MFTsu5.1 TaxID=1449044 RepID=UPI0018CC3216|nr:restriction endonuclease [Arthrobacter sp. UNC362MFTsu5.1]
MSRADIHVDAPIIGGRSGNAGDDPLAALLGVNNMGGFRYLGKQQDMRLLVVTTAGTDLDWPDSFDPETGVFTYFGDNKKPGQPLHGTPRRGNEILRQIFGAPKSTPAERHKIPPIFVFQSLGVWRDMKLLGVAVPTTRVEDADGPLVAVWRTKAKQRFQNYRAKFTVLDIPEIKRQWIDDIKAGNHYSDAAPRAWRSWIQTGVIQPLLAPLTERHRTREEQLPRDSHSQAVLDFIYSYFKDRPFDFEHFAADLLHLTIPNIASIDVTRPHRDGGRDAIGMLRVGTGPSSILIDFAMEAKCYSKSNGVGVRHVSRLISRLRHRQFGILVTTSYLNLQAYKEIVEDQHPIIVLAGADITESLRRSGKSDLEQIRNWLKTEYP